MIIACCIQHNMIIEEERDSNISFVVKSMRVENTHRNLNFEENLQSQVEIKNKDL